MSAWSHLKRAQVLACVGRWSLCTLVHLTLVHAQVLYVAWPADVDELDPPRYSTASTTEIGILVHEGLVTIGEGGEPEPVLAAAWHVSDDLLTWTFHLRADVSFHSGNPLTAGDVVWSLDRAFVDLAGGPRLAPASTEQIDDFTVLLRFNRPTPDLLATLAAPEFAIVDAAWYQIVGEGYGTAPSGTGPYKVGQFVAGRQLVLESHGQYWRAGAPRSEVLVFELIADPYERAEALRSGAVDVAFDIPAAASDALALDPENRTYAGEPSVVAIGLDTLSEPFDDPRVRRALALAIDYTGIAALFDDADPAFGHGIFTPRPERSDAWYAHDPERARELLAEAGWLDGFDIEVRTADTGGTSRILLDVLARMWSDIGVTLTILEEDASDLHQALTDARAGSTPFQAWVYGSELRPRYERADWIGLTCEPGPRNWDQFCSPEIDALLQQQRFAVDPGVRARFQREIERAFVDETPIIPIASVRRHVAALQATEGPELPDDALPTVLELQGTADLVLFEREAPTPSRLDQIDEQLVIDGGQRDVELRYVADVLSAALRWAGHELYFMPLFDRQGFVIATSFEWIEETDGRSLVFGRFGEAVPRDCDNRSLDWLHRAWACFAASVQASSGVARAIVFRVAAEGFRPTETFPGRQELLSWRFEGESRLPPALEEGGHMFDATYGVEVLVYEFEVSGPAGERLRIPSPWSGRQHLERSCASAEDVPRCVYEYLTERR